MRFVLAISALVLSGIMLILGIGQATFLAGPREIVYETQFDAPSGLAVIRADQLVAVKGQANVIVDGVDSFVAAGKSRDVDAWLAPFAHAEIEVDVKSRALVFNEIAQNPEAAKAFLEIFPLEEEAVEGESAEAVPDAGAATAPTAAQLAAIVPPSAFGSDLWLEQRGQASDEAASGGEQPVEGDTESEAEPSVDAANATPRTVRLPVSLQSDQSVILTAGEGASARVSIEWVQDRRTPLAGPLLAAGGLFALIGAVLYLLAVDHDRRGLGPRRGRRGPLLGIRNLFAGRSRAGDTESPEQKQPEKSKPGKKKRVQPFVAVSALALSGALGLSGCSPSYWPELADSSKVSGETAVNESTSLAPVPVTQGQIDRIVADVVAVAGKADETLDGSELGTRFVGDALVERLANYKIRAAVSDYEVVVPRLTDRALDYQLVQSTEEWPRTIFVVVESESGAPVAETAEPAAEEAEAATEEASPSLALIMTQANPYENFLVSRTIALRGGITMPEAAPAEEGTALLADDLKSLVMTPTEVGESYAAVLAGGVEVEQAEHFDLVGDSLIERSGAAWVAQSAAAASAAGQGINYSVSAAQSESDIVSLSTGVGGALVATTLLETRVEEPDGGRWRPTVPKSLTALSGLEGQQDKLVSVVSHQLLFFVPSATAGGTIQLLGYTSDLIEARNS